MNPTQFYKNSFLLPILLLFSCARGINKDTKIVKIHSDLPYVIVSQKGNFNSFREYDISKYDTATLIRAKSPLIIKVMVGDSSQVLEVKSKLSPLVYLNLPSTIIGTVGLFSFFAFNSSPAIPLGFGTFGYGGFNIDLKSARRFTYPHHIYIYEANNKAYYLPFNKKILSQKNILKFSPIRLIDTYTPSFELAYERKLSRAFSAQFLYANLNKKPANIGLANTFSGKRFGYELKYFFKRTAPFGPYISLDHNRLTQKYSDILKFTKKDSSRYIPYRDSVNIERKINSLNIKIGYQYIKNHFAIDFGFGIGKRIENIRQEGRINNNDLTFRGGIFSKQGYPPGRYGNLNLPITVKLGYSF